jgi:hypothetical protein
MDWPRQSRNGGLPRVACTSWHKGHISGFDETHPVFTPSMRVSDPTGRRGVVHWRVPSKPSPARTTTVSGPLGALPSCPSASQPRLRAGKSRLCVSAPQRDFFTTGSRKGAMP